MDFTEAVFTVYPVVKALGNYVALKPSGYAVIRERRPGRQLALVADILRAVITFSKVALNY